MLKRDGMPRHREVPSPSPLSVLDRTAGKEQRHRRLVPLFLVGALLVGTEATAEVVLDPGESAWAAVQRGQLERAREEAAAVLADDSKDARAAVVYAETVTMPAIDEGGETAQLPLPELLEGLHATAATRGHALVARAVLWRRAERPDLAETDLLAAREVAERQGDEELAMIVAEQLAVTLVSLARPPEAIAAAEEALVAAEARERPVAAVLAHLTLGRALVRTRQVELAEEHLQAARDGARRLDLPRWEGTAEIALSVLSRFRMDLDEAMVRREAALDAYRRGHDLSGQARALHYIATIRIFRGELSAAMGQLLEALELARSAENDVETSGCLGDLAGINYLLGDLEQARIQYEEAVRLTDHPLRRGLWQINLGSILTHQDRHEEALASYREALESLRAIGDRRNESVALLSIGRSLVELGRTEEGLAQLQEAVAVARRWEQPENEAQVLRFLGLAVAARGDLTAAADTLAHATELARRTGNYQILEASLVTEAGLARRRGQFDEAQHIIDEALLVVGDVRRRSGGAAAVQSGVFAEAYEVYGLAIDLLYQQHRKEPSAGHDLRAFELAQEAKARSFLDLLAEAEVDLRCRADARYVTREAEILDEIADLDGRGLASPDSASILAARIAGLEDELDLLEADIRAADPRYAAVRYPRPCDLPTARRLLADDEALVEFALGDSASYVWAITDTDLVFAALPPRREIETEVRELLPLLQDPNLTGDDPAWYHPAAGALFDRLLGPVRSVIAGRERLVIAPDGLLHYLPIEALLVRRPSSEEASSYASLPYLRDAYVVSYVPSVSVLHHLRDGDAIAAANRYLLVGDPVTGPRAFRLGAFRRARIVQRNQASVFGPALEPRSGRGRRRVPLDRRGLRTRPSLPASRAVGVLDGAGSRGRRRGVGRLDPGFLLRRCAARDQFAVGCVRPVDGPADE